MADVDRRSVSGRRQYSVRVRCGGLPVRLVSATAPEVKAERQGLPVFGRVYDLTGARLEVRAEGNPVRLVREAYTLQPSDELWLVPEAGADLVEVYIAEGFTP